MKRVLNHLSSLQEPHLVQDVLQGPTMDHWVRIFFLTFDAERGISPKRGIFPLTTQLNQRV